MAFTVTWKGGGRGAGPVSVLSLAPLGREGMGEGLCSGGEAAVLKLDLGMGA